MRKYQIPLLATIFNLLFEYSLRGLNGFIERPWLIFFLGAVYFCWFLMTEDLIRRFRPGDLRVMLLPFFGIGTIYSVLFIPSRAYYLPPFVLGINVGQFIWITFIWWTLLQMVMTMYFANRIAKRTSYEPILSKKGWIVVMSIWLFVGYLFRINIPFPKFSLVTYFSTFCIAFFSARAFFKGKPTTTVATPSRFMDVLTFMTVIIFIISALVFSQRGLSDFHPINVDSLKYIVAWTTVSGVAMILYRIFKRKPFLV